MWRQGRVGSDDDVRRACWSSVLFVPGLVLAFLVGGGLLAALGYAEAEASLAGTGMSEAFASLNLLQLLARVVLGQ